MKKLWIILALLCAPCFGQLPQFTGLMTNTTDLTCAGVVPCSTWPMPANPGMGNSYADPAWGTTTWELNVPPQNTGGNVIPVYSRVQGFSSDNSRLIMSEGETVYTDLYDATTTPPRPINRITTTDGSWIAAGGGDVNWANTVPTRLYYIGGFQQTGSLQLRYVDVSACTTSSCVLTPTIVHIFSCTSDSYYPGGSGLPGNQIETGSGAQGGMFDLTDTYFSFTCDIVGENGRGEIDFIRYNRSTDTVTTQEKWYTVCPGDVPSGCEVWNAGQTTPGYNMIRMNQHPDANYITVIWQCGLSPWQAGCGTEVYGPAYNFLGPASASNDHQDNGFDVNGIPVWVGVQGDEGNDSDYWSISIANLTTLSTSGVTSKEIQLPCSFAYSGATPCEANGVFLSAKTNASHISMTGTWGSTPGYALYSTMTLAGENYAFDVDFPFATTLGTAVTGPGTYTVTPGSMANIAVGTQQVIELVGNANIETVTVTGTTSTTFTATFAKAHSATAPVSNLTVGDTGPYAMENIAVKIDTSAADGSSAQVWRLGRAMSIRDADYGAEPHTFVNRDWTAYVWGSNWNTDGGADNAYYTKLSGAASYTLTVSTSGTGSGTINITNNCTTGSYASGTTIGACTATPSGGSVFAGWTGTLGCTGTGACTASLTGNSTMNAVFNLAPTSAPAMMQGIGRLQGTSVIQ